MNYYSILGVTRTAEEFVIKAAYKALMRAYHPDRVKGYEELVKTINQAYEVLSDPLRRAEYDKIHSDLVDESTFEDKESSFDIDADINSDWLVMSEFYPELEKARQELCRYSSTLSTSYVLKMLESKDFKNYLDIANDLKEKYLQDYFGKNVRLVALAEQLLLAKARKPLLEINKLIRIMGEELDEQRIIKTLENKYPEVNQVEKLAYSEYIKKLTKSTKELVAKARNRKADFNDVTLFAEKLGIKAVGKKGFITDSWKIIDISGQEPKYFYGSDDFGLYLLSVYENIVDK